MSNNPDDDSPKFRMDKLASHTEHDLPHVTIEGLALNTEYEFRTVGMRSKGGEQSTQEHMP